ncbi:S-layer homology domain-containing protein [Tumebacillus permanentifrigoris]|uniref:S-layer homology domain-containing protein n=1 Tax=Tumebacillus permanentifrigoris TaxID=378543 RepID=UPI0014754C58|nr:S-layer homology domain-containing protein [Tumebacillus permanentifrigoris]
MKTISKWLATTLVLSTALAPTAVLAETPTTSTSSTTTVQLGSVEGILDLQKADDWAQDAIVQAKQLGLMNGDPSGRFRPTDTITRAEFAVMLTRLLHLDVPTVQASSFADVPASHWGLSHMEAVKTAGVMLGDGDGTFRPEDAITREELAVLLVKAGQSDAQDGEPAVADHADVSGWAKGYVQKALTMGLMSGDGTNFAPKQATVRQEVAMVAVNFVAKVPSTVDIVADDQVTVKGIPYQVVDPLKPLFNRHNSQALKNAKMRFEVKDKVITKVTYLELVNGGQAAAAGEQEFSGNAVLDAGNATISGHLVVSADYVSVQNLKVSGNLEVAQRVQHDFYSNQLRVEGKTIINGGDANTVVFDRATLHTVEINKLGVHVQTAIGTVVDELVVQSDARIEVLGVTIPKVTVTAGVKQLQLDGNGTITSLRVADKNAKVTLQTGTRVQSLDLPTGVQAADVITNYEQVKGQIGGSNGGSTGGANTGDGYVVRTSAPSVQSISVQETAGQADTVVVKNVPANTKVRVYDSIVAGHLISEGVSNATATSDVVLHLPTPLTAEQAYLYISLQTGVREESYRTEKHFQAGWIADVALSIAHRPGAHAFEAALKLQAGRTLGDLSAVEVAFSYSDEYEQTVLATLQSLPAFATGQEQESSLHIVATREQKANDPDLHWKRSDWNGNHFNVPNALTVQVTDGEGNLHRTTQSFGDLSAPALAAINEAKTAEALQAVLEDDLYATALGVDTTSTSTYARLTEAAKQQLLADLVGTYAQTSELRALFEDKINAASRMTVDELKAATQALLDALPESDAITLDNYSAVLQQVELAEGMVANCLAQGIPEDELVGLDKLRQDRSAVDWFAASADQMKFLALADAALAQLPEVDLITKSSLTSLQPQIEAATTAVKAARANGTLTHEFTGLEKLVRVVRLKVDMLFATDANGEIDKTRLADDFTEEKLFEVADLFNGLVDPSLTTLAGKDPVQARHDYVEAMQRIKSLGLGADIYAIGDDMNLAYILYLVQNFEGSANGLPATADVTLADRGTVAFLLDQENSILLMTAMSGIFLPNQEQFEAAGAKLHEAAAVLAPAVIESLFTDNTHSELADAVDQGSFADAYRFMKYADPEDQEALNALYDQAQQMFADLELVVPEILLAWTPNFPNPDSWNKELVAGDTLLAAGNKRGKIYLVPKSESPYSTEELEALVTDHKAVSAAITGAGEGLVGELFTTGLPSTQYRLFIADQFGHVKFDRTVYTIVDNVIPYVVWPLRDQHIKVNAPVPFVDNRFTFADTADDTLTYTVASSDESVVQALIDGESIQMLPISAGTATITVTATDSRGATCTDSFEVIVDAADPNHEPVISAAIPDQAMTLGDADLTFDMTNVFTDEDGDALEILVPTSDDESVATVTFDGITMTLHAVGTGSTTIRVRVTDGKGGAPVELTFLVQIS